MQPEQLPARNLEMLQLNSVRISGIVVVPFDHMRVVLKYGKSTVGVWHAKKASFCILLMLLTSSLQTEQEDVQFLKSSSKRFKLSGTGKELKVTVQLSSGVR